MALSYEECQTMINASEKLKIPVFVAYYRRFFPYFIKIKEIIENKLLGEIINCQLTTVLAPRKADFDKENLPWHFDRQVRHPGGCGQTAADGPHGYHEAYRVRVANCRRNGSLIRAETSPITNRISTMASGTPVSLRGADQFHEAAPNPI